ncbi:S-adenosyl-L-methionine-dependent methyltransferase [Leucosporidium creatinivorum]|uniref:S-adenosyl-L-methionine-dependent methyltransferase n=1 Tax=Leucosporidium creatinivorum TaxID=106004 RepID=A0A1Y2FZ98_9BASI|nr:S-adenosyl-L-methionine-dependent methyltransferase [Leucosporidium creatinivorum]
MASASSSTPANDQWSAGKYNNNASFVYSKAFTNAVVQLLDPKPTDHILDLGCGSGELTLEIAPQVASIVGVDLSANLLAKAKANAAASSAGDNLTLIERDGHDLSTLPAEHQGAFDAVFSSAAMHWMKREPKEVAKGAYGVLKKGGRFVSEMGGALNMVGVRSTLHQVLKRRGHEVEKLDPWYFPTPTEQKRVLGKAGFRVESCELVPRITPLPTGLSGWLETFGFAFLDHLSPTEKQEVIDEVCDALKVDMWSEDEGWVVMYVRLRFKAWKD